MRVDEEDRNRESRWQLNLFITVVLLISALLFIAALITQLKKPTVNPDPAFDTVINCLYSVATSLVASILVVYFSSKILGEPLDKFISETKNYIRQLSILNESAGRSGLVQVFPRRAEAQELFFDLLGTRWMALDIMAVKIEFLARDPRFEDYLMSGCERGAKVRILLIDTEDRGKLQERAKYEARNDFTDKALIAIASYKSSIEKCYQNPACIPNLELRGHQEYLPISMVRVDDEMLYYSRTRNQRGAECPLYRIKRVPGGIFDIYHRDFEMLWRKYEPKRVSTGEISCVSDC